MLCRCLQSVVVHRTFGGWADCQVSSPGLPCNAKPLLCAATPSVPLTWPASACWSLHLVLSSDSCSFPPMQPSRSEIPFARKLFPFCPLGFYHDLHSNSIPTWSGVSVWSQGICSSHIAIEVLLVCFLTPENLSVILEEPSQGRASASSQGVFGFLLHILLQGHDVWCFPTPPHPCPLHPLPSLLACPPSSAPQSCFLSG